MNTRNKNRAWCSGLKKITQCVFVSALLICGTSVVAAAVAGGNAPKDGIYNNTDNGSLQKLKISTETDSQGRYKKKGKDVSNNGGEPPSSFKPITLHGNGVVEQNGKRVARWAVADNGDLLMYFPNDQGGVAYIAHFKPSS